MFFVFTEQAALIQACCSSMDVRHNRTTIQEDDMPKRIVGFDQKERNAICRSVYHSYSHRSREFWKIRLEMLERRDADLEECANRRQDIRDQIQWIYGSGLPKSMDVSKAIDKAAGAERTEILGPKAGHENFVGRDNMKSLREGTMSQEGGFARPWMSDPEAVERAHHSYAPATDSARQWSGWGTALKPAHEPIVMARKPLG